MSLDEMKEGPGRALIPFDRILHGIQHLDHQLEQNRASYAEQSIVNSASTSAAAMKLRKGEEEQVQRGRDDTRDRERERENRNTVSQFLKCSNPLPSQREELFIHVPFSATWRILLQRNYNFGIFRICSLSQKHWQEVADIVNARDDYTKPSKTDVQCKNRIDTLKKKYKLEKARSAAGAGPSKWAFFKRLERLIGPNHYQNKIHKTPAVSFLPPPPSKATAVSSADRNACAKVPMAIPFGARSFHQVQKKSQAQLPSLRPGTISSKTAAAAAAAAVSAPPSPDSSDSFPPETADGKKRKGESGDPPPRSVPARRMQHGGEGLRVLAKAILKFGEVYERVESSKLQQVVEMEKQWMGFAKELELQRVQFFMKTQMEFTQLKRHGRFAALAGNSDSDDTS